jgi:hypothetical protein
MMDATPALGDVMNLSNTLRYASASLALALAVSLPSLAGAATFAGSWSFSGASRGETIAPVCVFRQSGSVVAGSCKGPAGIGSASGSANGGAIVFQWTRIATSSLQNTSVVTFRGVSNGSAIRGTFTDSAHPGVVGSFSARRI